MRKKLTAIICLSAILISVFIPVFKAGAFYSESNLKKAVEKAVEWKNDKDNPMYSIGSNSANMYVIALKRLGVEYDYFSYLKGMDGVAAGYGSEHTASDMARAVMAVIAAGGDAQNVGGRDLVADATYFRDNVASLDKEGVNGSAWALIAMDSNDYGVPDWAKRNRNEIISNILCHQNTDGSFDGDVYATASAITALSRYAKTSGGYDITRMQNGEKIALSPNDAIYNGLGYLSSKQNDNGGWDNAIATAMAVIAIESSGSDAASDPRFFIKNKSAVDGLMKFQNADGGFSENGGESKGEETSYAICALSEVLGKQQGKNNLFYFRGNDTITAFEKPAETDKPEATEKASEEKPSSSASTSAATQRPAATQKPAANTATTKPATQKTTKPTTRPAVTVKPAVTMRPTKTAAPHTGAAVGPAVSPSPMATVKPTSRPTSRPALVGPVEMPGPMQPDDKGLSGDEDVKGMGNRENTSNSPLKTIIPLVIALLALGAFVALFILQRNGMLPVMSKKKNKRDEYKAKVHRKTEMYRNFDKREKYKRRLKYNHAR